MNRAQKENTTPLVLISHPALQTINQPHNTTSNQSQDNVHVRFAANIGRVLHTRAARKLAKILERHPGVFAVHSDNLIAIPSPTAQGFSMAIATDRGRCTVGLGQWKDDFVSVDEAVGLIEDALHGDVRLRVEIGEHASWWVLERRLPDGAWLEQPRSFFNDEPGPGARNIRIAYLHNDFRRIQWTAID